MCPKVAGLPGDWAGAFAANPKRRITTGRMPRIGPLEKGEVKFRIWCPILPLLT